MYLLDTNAVSELRRPPRDSPSMNFARWISGMRMDDLYLSAVTLEELKIGVLRMERRDPRQGAALRLWINKHVLPAFEGRILPLDQRVAFEAARLHVPNPIAIRDGYIAATALVHDMSVVTRNVGHFEASGVRLLNPWGS
jgi:predicted nucleic acid-binding protein